MKSRLLLKNFRLVDEATDTPGAIVVEDGIIRDVIAGENPPDFAAGQIIDGGGRLALLPAFVDLHAHFRDPGLLEKETLESGCLSAAAGGYGTVVCMANTKPVTDTFEKVAAMRARAAALGLIDLYPALSVTKGMEGKALTLTADTPAGALSVLSEDGKDVADDALFAAAFLAAKRMNLLVSCHCDAGGGEAAAAKKAGAGRDLWSVIEENTATRRAIALGKRAGGRVHIAHVSTKEATAMVREAKRTEKREKMTDGAAALSCEVTPHHIALTLDDAALLGAESHGRVNPPLRKEDDRLAIIAAILDGTVDAVATDHAPHSEADKAAGAPGFSGLETAFSVCYTTLVEGVSRSAGAGASTGRHGTIDLKRLCFLMSGNPARILGLKDRGRLVAGARADLTLIDTAASRAVDPALFKSRGKNTPFTGRPLRGKVMMTLHGGRIVYQAN